MAFATCWPAAGSTGRAAAPTSGRDRHHTGFFGGLLRPLPELLAGSMGLWLNTLLGGTTYRTHVHKEYASYLWSYAMLGTLSYLLGNVCSDRPDCLPCCDAHLQWLQDARERQNPWSTYGD